MERSPFLPLPEGMVIGQVELTADRLIVEVISTQPIAHCPGCGNPSDHIHGQYQRMVHDVPCGGRSVVLRLRARKFFCRAPTCPRKVFTERLPELVQPWARVSNRLLQELQALGLSTSAEGSRREELRVVYLLSQEFVTLLNERQAEALDSWLTRANECHVTELTSFVNGIRRDYATVRAACSCEWSNGTTEGMSTASNF